tara:strand:+ start:337 stop:597 length:261 start_codon:yes stop_codon:yes gene_type:complete
MIIGIIDGNDVTYNKEKDTVSCKGHEVSALLMLRAYSSSSDRENIKTEIVLRKFKTGVTLGCFDINTENSNNLIKSIKHARIKKKN